MRSTYVSDVLALSSSTSLSSDSSARAGSLALLLYALVSLFFASLLPWLTLLGNHPRILRFLRRGGAGRRGMARILSAATLRNFWTAGLVMHAAIMAGTFWVDTVEGATVIIALMGVVWSIGGWVPYALVLEAVREYEDPQLPPEADFSDPSFPSPEKAYSRPFSSSSDDSSASPSASRPSSAPRPPPSTTPRIFPHSLFSTALLHRSNIAGAAASSSHLGSTAEGRAKGAGGGAGAAKEAGGAILGLHNLAIVLPQFLMAGGAAAAFALADHLSSSSSSSGGEKAQATNEVVWLFRVGGVCALVGAVVSRCVEETGSEKEYRERVYRAAGMGE
ncbi:hypothetical protein JCM10213v2_007734 [Rhodosporidiobolus nylandii]